MSSKLLMHLYVGLLLILCAEFMLPVSCMFIKNSNQDINLNHKELLAEFYKLPAEIRELAYIPGINENQNQVSSNQLGALPPINCIDNNVNCKYFIYYCKTFNASLLNYPLTLMCGATCNTCAGSSTVTTTQAITTTPATCTPSPCQNNAVCILSGSSVICLCQTGYVGSLCQYGSTLPPTTTLAPTTTNNNCLNSPCRNGGTCINTGVLSYRCQCAAGFAGENCEHIDRCETNPCVSPAICLTEIMDRNSTFFACALAISMVRDVRKHLRQQIATTKQTQKM